LNGAAVATALSISSWSTYPATSTLQMSNYPIINVSSIAVGTSTSSPYTVNIPNGSLNASEVYVNGVLLSTSTNIGGWAGYPAISNINMDGNYISNLGQGTATSTAIRCESANGTGIYFPSSTQVGIAANSTGIAVFNSNAVGIATLTPTPGYRLTVSGGMVATGSNVIGGVTLNGGNVSNSTTSTNNIGGVVMHNNTVYLTSNASGADILHPNMGERVALVCPQSGSPDCGKLVFGNGDSTWKFSFASRTSGTITDRITFTDNGNISNSNTTSNNIGGVILNNSAITTGNFSVNTIGGVTLDAGNISNLNTSSNRIGGVTLNNTNITTSGLIQTGATTSNNIGGVTLSNTNITTSGLIQTGSTTSNNIGGVTLSDGLLRAGVWSYGISTEVGNFASRIRYPVIFPINSFGSCNISVYDFDPNILPTGIYILDFITGEGNFGRALLAWIPAVGIGNLNFMSKHSTGGTLDISNNMTPLVSVVYQYTGHAAEGGGFTTLQRIIYYNSP
jgi:hypothetical protein